MKLTKSQLKEMIREELKLTEAKWEVYDNYTGKTIKVVGNAGAATKLMNKLLDSGKVKEPAAKIVREGKLNEDDYATQYLDKIDSIKDNVWQRSISIQQMLKKQDKITGTKNADAYNKVLLKHFKKFYLEAKKIQKMIKD